MTQSVMDENQIRSLLAAFLEWLYVEHGIDVIPSILERDELTTTYAKRFFSSTDIVED